MKILVEIDLPDIEPNDIYKPDSKVFDNKGNIYIPKKYLQFVEQDLALLKYMGQVHDEVRL